jgi:hypothetical protein
MAATPSGRVDQHLARVTPRKRSPIARR